MYYSGIKHIDVANGIGVRVSLFVSGCTNKCEDCFNPETWDFKHGNKFTQKNIDEIITALKPDYIDGLTILGGEPFELSNQKGILPLIKLVRETLPNKSIWIYTGFKLDEDLIEGGKRYSKFTNEILNNIDILVDGKFDKNLKDLKLRFRGSSNQRIIDIKKTIENKKIILLDI